MSLFRPLLTVALLPLVAGATFAADERPKFASTTDTIAAQHKQVIPLEPGIPIVAENLKTYLIPCHRDVGTTIYVEDHIIDVAGQYFWMEGSKVARDPAFHQWVFSFNNEEGSNYITLFPNPELEPSEVPVRRNLNIICKGKVFTIEPYAVANEAQAVRMVYFRATDKRLRVESQGAPNGVPVAPQGREAEPFANGAAKTVAGPYKSTGVEAPGVDSARLTKVSPVTPQIKNHGITPNVLISYLQKFKLLSSLPGMEMPDVEVLDKHFPAADYKGIKSGILSSYRDRNTEVMGFHCYLKNASKEQVTLNDRNLSVRVGEKVFLCKLTDPAKIALSPGEECKFISVFQERDFATLSMKDNQFSLITDLSIKPVAGTSENVAEEIAAPIDGVAGLDGVLAKVIRAPKSETASAIIAVRNGDKATVDLRKFKITATVAGRAVEAFRAEPSDGWEIASEQTKGFAVFFHDAALASNAWGTAVTLKIEAAK